MGFHGPIIGSSWIKVNKLPNSGIEQGEIQTFLPMYGIKFHKKPNISKY